MNKRWQMFLAGLAACLVLPPPVASGEDPPPTESKATEDQEEQRTPLTAIAVEVIGDVATASVGTSPLDAKAWEPVKVQDELASGTMIRTGIRSQLTLRFGDDQWINVSRVTLASIDAFYKTKTTKTTRLGLGYGAIRGGSTEGTLRSDLVIDSTVATLAKRGTQDFRLSVEPYTGRFTISLAREGLVEALQKATGQRRDVHPGEYANESNIATMWIKQDQFDRSVRFVASESMSTADLDFSTANVRGLGSIAPGAGDQAPAFSRPAERDFVVDQVTEQMRRPSTDVRSLLPEMVVVEQGPVRRREGDFGVPNTIRILVPEPRGGQKIRRFFSSGPTQRDVDRWSQRRFGRRKR